MVMMLIPMMWQHRPREEVEPRRFFLLRNPVGGWGWRRYLSAKVVGDYTPC